MSFVVFSRSQQSMINKNENHSWKQPTNQQTSNIPGSQPGSQQELWVHGQPGQVLRGELRRNPWGEMALKYHTRLLPWLAGTLYRLTGHGSALCVECTFSFAIYINCVFVTNVTCTRCTSELLVPSFSHCWPFWDLACYLEPQGIILSIIWKMNKKL